MTGVISYENKHFSEEEIRENDLFFVCYMIERVARRLRQYNAHVVNKIGREGLHHLLGSAQVLHAANPLQVEEDWIHDYQLDRELCPNIPSPADMGMVYGRLIDSISDDYVDGLHNVCNNNLCKVIDNYNSSAYLNNEF